MVPRPAATYISAFAGYADSAAPFRFVSTTLTALSCPAGREAGMRPPGSRRERDVQTSG